jgi:hypothetical protein
MTATNYKEQDEKIKIFQNELHALGNEDVNSSYEIHFEGPAGHKTPVFLFKDDTKTSRDEREDAYDMFLRHFPHGKMGSF